MRLTKEMFTITLPNSVKVLGKSLFIMCFATWIFFIQIMGQISHIPNVSCTLCLNAENAVSLPFHLFSDTGTPYNSTAICPLTSSSQHLQYLHVPKYIKTGTVQFFTDRLPIKYVPQVWPLSHHINIKLLIYSTTKMKSKYNIHPNIRQYRPNPFIINFE